MDCQKTANQIKAAALEDLLRDILKRQNREEIISYVVTFLFALSSVAIVALSLILHQERIALPCGVALLMVGFHSSMAWIKRTQVQSLLILWALMEAIRPGAAKPLNAARRNHETILALLHETIPGPSTKEQSVKTRVEEAAAPKVSTIKESAKQAYERLVTNAPSLLPQCELGTITRNLFEEFLAEQELDKRSE